MPDFFYSDALTANQLDQRPLANWQYRRLPFDAVVTVLQRATTTGARTTIYSGAQTIVQRSRVQAGGTAGTTPSPLNTPVLEFIGQAGDELIISNDEVAAGTPTIDGWVHIEPV